MITGFGKVTLSVDDILIEGFVFDGVDLPTGRLEALRWARQKVQAALNELEIPRDYA